MEGAPKIDSAVEQPKFLSKIDKFARPKQMKGIIALLSGVDFEERDSVSEENITSVLKKYPQRDSFNVAGLDVVEFIGQENGPAKAEEYRTSLALLGDVLYEGQPPKNVEEAGDINPPSEGVPQIDSKIEQSGPLSKIEAFPEEVSRKMKGIIAELSGRGFENRFQVTEEDMLFVKEKYNSDSFEGAGLVVLAEVSRVHGQEKANEYTKALLLLEGILYEDQIFKQLENHFLAILQDMVNAGKPVPMTDEGQITEYVLSEPLFIKMYREGLFFRNINNGYFGPVLEGTSESSKEQQRLQGRILKAQYDALDRFNKK